MNVCNPHQFQYLFQDLDGDRRSFVTIHCAQIVKKKFWWPSRFHGTNFWMVIKGFSLPSMHAERWQKTFHHHPNSEMDTGTDVDNMGFFTHSRLNLWKFESRLSQSKRFAQNKKLQHQHINLLSYILLSDALFSWILKTKDKGKSVICSTLPLFTLQHDFWWSFSICICCSILMNTMWKMSVN